MNKGPPFERSAKKTALLVWVGFPDLSQMLLGNIIFFRFDPSHMFVYLAKALAIRRGSNWLWEEGTELGHVHLLFTSLKSKLI